VFDNTGIRSGNHLNGDRGALEFDPKAVARFMPDQLRTFIPARSHLSAFCRGIVVGLNGKPVQFLGNSRREQFPVVIAGGIEFRGHRMRNDRTGLFRPRFLEQTFNTVRIQQLPER